MQNVFLLYKRQIGVKTSRVAHVESNGALVFHSKIILYLFSVNFTSMIIMLSLLLAGMRSNFGI